MKDILVYFSIEKVLIGISISLVIVYSIWILTTHKSAKTSIEKQSVKFEHQVLWGNVETLGTLHYITSKLFIFIGMLFVGKYVFYMYKHNKDLFQNITGDNPEENLDEDLD